MTGYEIAHDLNLLGQRVVAEYHPHLIDAKIAYLYRLGPWKEKGFAQIGKAVMAQAAWRALSGYDVLVIIHKASYLKISDKAGEKGRLALLDYAFSHLSETRNLDSCGRPVFQAQGHDIREFSGVVNRHGVCFSQLLALAEGENSGVQLSLESYAPEIEQAAAEEAAEEEATELIANEEEAEPYCTIEEGDGSCDEDVAVLKSYDFD